MAGANLSVGIGECPCVRNQRGRCWEGIRRGKMCREHPGRLGERGDCVTAIVSNPGRTGEEKRGHCIREVGASYDGVRLLRAGVQRRLKR